MANLQPHDCRLADLVNRKETIFCMSTSENQKILEEFGAKFISYPDSIIPVSIRKEIMEQLDSAEMRSIKKADIRKLYDIALEKDIEMLYDMTEDQVSKLEKIILDNHIDIIFRDAVDKYGEVIAKRLNMPLISYSTHNLYSLNIEPTWRLLEEVELEKTIVSCTIL